jgi:hypothetical protein
VSCENDRFFRQNLDATWTRASGQRRTVLSGLPAQAKTLYVSVQVIQAVVGKNVDLELTGSRNGWSFTKRFTLAPGQVVSINADGMTGAKIDIIASSVTATAGGQVVASWSPAARDTADECTGWWLDQYAAATVYAVPDGAELVAIYGAAPASFDWILYDDTGTERTIAGPAVAGATGEVLGTHFRPGSAFYGAFRIRL